MEIVDHREEVASALTHGVGVAGSMVGGAVLVTLAWPAGEVWEIVGAVVFSATLLLLYSASTLFHAARDLALRARLQVLDHCAIFLLIAGTYTPFTLVSLRGPWGWTLFGTVWTLALAGVVFKLFLTGRYRRLSTALYLGMGWMAVVAARPLLEALPVGVLAWTVVGGLCYTAGTLFYHSDRVPYAHAIWHLFVLGGSTCHFFAVLSQVSPAA
jgi:hemolysin III